MRLKEAILIATAATAMFACHGELVIGEGDSGVGGGSSGGPGMTFPDGGESVQVPTPDGGVLSIAPQTYAVNKLDLLFMIDNSASMGDKQAYLGQAIPELVARLATPNCVDPNNGATVYGASTIDANGLATCAQGAPEFPAVHDMHIGVVSSSLGSRLSESYASGSGAACLPNSTVKIGVNTVNNHDDDQAHLITRSVSSPGALQTTDLADAPSGFLAWFPSVGINSGSSVTPGATAITNAATLDTDFSDIMGGVQVFGCGIESQLESWYRFLIQPDPYASLTLDGSQHAQWVGVDQTILKQRHDFLRPDSLVAIVDLTDENDSEIDVRSFGGQGYVFMSTAFQPPQGTAACATNPGDPSCQTQGTGGPKYTATNDWGYDLNLRHVHMKAKYGLDPQFPLSRYQNGLLSATVPDRTGEYPSGAVSYVGTNNCTNPLFAASLPDGSALSSGIASQETASDAAALCNLPLGKRTGALVFYLHIGGVPWQLLHFDPSSAANSQLTADDWNRIVGKDPLNYDYSGIDPHMIESYQPRTGPFAFSTAAPLPALNSVAGVSAAETAPQPAAGAISDPYNGREWNTNQGPHVDLAVDREYACIFKLAQPRDCSKQADGTYTVPTNAQACDCSSTGLASDQLSPVCDPATPTSQLYAKAYPTIRELELARLVGSQGLVASICPINTVDDSGGSSPLYGYRPAVSNLINRMRPALAYAE